MGVQSPGMKKNRIRLIGSISGSVLLVGALAGLLLGIPALVDANRPTPVAPAEVADAPVYLIPDYRHPTPTPEPVVEPAPAPVEEPYVEPYVEPPYSNSGSAVPFIPSDDPNNANGGDYLDPGGYCTSGSASGYPPVCD